MNNVYEIAKDRLLKKLEEAAESGKRFAWVKPWSGGCPYAMNYATKKPYRGINALILDSGEYLTFNQTKDLQKKDEKVHLKKGSESFPVFFFKFRDVDEEAEGEKKKPPIFRYYRVFSIDDIEGVSTGWPYVKVEHTLTKDMERAQAIIESYVQRSGLKLEVVEGSARAYYSPANHAVRMPEMGQFESVYKYFSTCFHELVHSTGKQLSREMDGTKASKKYAAEELVAEIGAAMLCAKYNIADDRTEDNSVAYLQHWIDHLKAETGLAVVQAVSKAQKACDLICNEYQDQAAKSNAA